MDQETITELQKVIAVKDAGELLGAMIAEGYSVTLSSAPFMRQRYYFSASNKTFESRISSTENDITAGLRDLALMVCLVERGNQKRKALLAASTSITEVVDPNTIAVAAE